MGLFRRQGGLKDFSGFFPWSAALNKIKATLA